MPSEQIQSTARPKQKEARTPKNAQTEEIEVEEEETVKYDCDKFVANAAVYGNSFQWHVDADPWTVDERSEWAQEHGIYFNGVLHPSPFPFTNFMSAGTWKATIRELADLSQFRMEA